MTRISANELLQLKVRSKAKQSIKRKEKVYWTAMQYQSLYMMDNFLTEEEGTWDNLRCAENNMDRKRESQDSFKANGSKNKLLLRIR